MARSGDGEDGGSVGDEFADGECPSDVPSADGVIHRTGDEHCRVRSEFGTVDFVSVAGKNVDGFLELA